MVLRSQLGKIILAKVWGSVLCAGSGLLIVGPDFPNRRCFLALPFFVASLFTASLAILEVRDGVLHYKRLFKWTTISESEIVNARVEWSPIIGSLRLNSLLLPWGRLYFILDDNIDPNPLHEGTYALLRSIQKESVSKGNDVARAASKEAPRNRAQNSG